MIVAGIDLGKSGAVAVLDTDLTTAVIVPIPLDANEELDAAALAQELHSKGVQGICFEDCFRPVSLIRMVGEVQAVGKILQLDHVERVAVTSWKTRLLGSNSSDKHQSIRKATELYPHVNLIAEGGRKPKHDYAEALLIAHYLAHCLIGIKT